MTRPADESGPGLDLDALVGHVRTQVPAVTDLHVSRGAAGEVRVSLLRIAAEHRGNGHGQAALTLLLEWADRHGVTLVGSPEPAHRDGEQRVSRARLRRWYAAQGFRRNHGGRHPEYRDALVRLPRTPNPPRPSER